MDIIPCLPSSYRGSERVLTVLKMSDMLSDTNVGFSYVVFDSNQWFLSGFLQPIGALNPKRAAFYAERYETWDDDSTPSHHYTTMYSTAQSTLMWMLRIVSTCRTSHIYKTLTSGEPGEHTAEKSARLLYPVSLPVSLQEPFTTFFLNANDNKFDHPERAFSGIGCSWRNCQRDTADVKVTIPDGMKERRPEEMS